MPRSLPKKQIACPANTLLEATVAHLLLQTQSDSLLLSINHTHSPLLDLCWPPVRKTLIHSNTQDHAHHSLGWFCNAFNMTVTCWQTVKFRILTMHFLHELIGLLGFILLSSDVLKWVCLMTFYTFMKLLQNIILVKKYSVKLSYFIPLKFQWPACGPFLRWFYRR